jgi:hypothetical protein
MKRKEFVILFVALSGEVNSEKKKRTMQINSGFLINLFVDTLKFPHIS